MNLPEDLEIFRNLAQGRDWDKCQEMLPDLLLNLSPHEGIVIGIALAWDYLPSFERHHPNVSWPRDVLMTLRSLKPEYSINDLPQLVSEDFEAPGSNNFTAGLEEILMALRTDDPRRRAEIMTDAISEIMMAKLVEYWYTQHSYEWEAEKKVDPETGVYFDQNLTFGFWEDPETVERDKKAWLQLIDDIEKSIHNK